MQKHGRGIFVFIISTIAIGVLTLFSFIPFRILSAMGSWLGGLYYYLDRSRKQIGLNNLKIAFGENRTDTELQAILKSVYRNMGSSLFEFAALPRLNREKTERFVRFQGLEKLEAARKAGRGVILITAHFGNWELYIQRLAVSGYPLHIIVRQANVRMLHNFMTRCRETHGNRMIIRDHAAREILNILKQGKILGVMGDQRGSTSRGLMIDFFGRPAPTNPTPAKIMLKTGAAVLTTFGVRNPDQTHTVYINDPMEICRTEDMERDVFTITQNYMKDIEDMIRQYPDQWLWMHRRWMRRN
jgi:KDO2-lipid IV(A) lauroyltransferase